MCLALLWCVSACTPLVQTTNTELQPASLTSDIYITSDVVELPIKKWLPASQPDAILVGLHGFNDYHNGFAGFATFLAQRGIATIAYDQRGFGNTSQRGIWPGRELLEHDAFELVNLVRAVYPQTPIYLLGVSMGAAVALSTSVRYDELDVKGLILVAPAVWGGESFNWFLRSTMWFAAHVANGLLMGRGYVTISDNVEMIDVFHADPLVIASTRLDAVYGMTQLMDYAQDNVSNNNKPLYLFYGLKDEVIPLDAVCAFLKKISVPFDVHFYTDGYHLLLRDLKRKQVWQDILQQLISVNKTGNQSNKTLSSFIPDKCNE